MPYKRGKTLTDKRENKKNQDKPEQELTPAQRFKLARLKQKVKDASRSGKADATNMEIR